MKKREIGVRQLKNEAPRILSEVRENEAEYLVTRHGKPVAVISPVSDSDLSPDHEDNVTAFLTILRKTAKLVSESSATISAPAIVSRQRR